MGKPSGLFGVEIGGTKLQIVAGDSSGTIRRRWRAPANRAGGGPAICRQILEGIAALSNEVEPIAVGVGFGGPVDRTSGRVRVSHQVDGWNDFDLRGFLVTQSGLPVRIENDSNLATLAEADCGSGEHHSRVFYFNLGSGVGGGFVIDGSIYHGMPPGEMEFGHLKLDRSGATVESRCSGWAVDREIRAVRESSPQSVLSRSLPNSLGNESALLSDALNQDDPAAQTILHRLADDLALALSHVVHLLHPDVIVIGGGLSNVGEPLRAAVAGALEPFIMEVFKPAPAVMLAKLGEDAVPTGALLLARSLEVC